MSTAEQPDEPTRNVAPQRVRLPDTRQSITHKFCVNGHEGYITAGIYEDGRLAEVFIKMAKQGSTVSGLMDTIATLMSLSLQYGMPLAKLVEKFSHTRFEPSGWTTNEQIREASSVIDYIVRWLDIVFGEEPAEADIKIVKTTEPEPK